MKTSTVLSIIVFSLIAILQLLRFLLGWDVSVNGVGIPVWVSGMAFVALGGLAFMLWREHRTPTAG